MSTVPTLVLRVVSPSSTCDMNFERLHGWLPVWLSFGKVENCVESFGSVLQAFRGPGFAFEYQVVSIVGFVTAFWVEEYVFAQTPDP